MFRPLYLALATSRPPEPVPQGRLGLGEALAVPALLLAWPFISLAKWLKKQLAPPPLPPPCMPGTSVWEIPDAHGYQRMPIEFNPAKDGKVIQKETISFPKATGNWGPLDSWALVDSPVYREGTALASDFFSVGGTCVWEDDRVRCDGMKVVFELKGINKQLVHKILNEMFVGPLRRKEQRA